MVCCDGKSRTGGCFCCPEAFWFKLSLLGVLASVILVVLGAFTSYGRVVVKVPVAYLLSVLIVLPSIVAYYRVRDKFWAKVFEEYQNRKK